ncbi:MAG: DUF520 family protein, partial [Actinomycetota bacterium]
LKPRREGFSLVRALDGDLDEGDRAVVRVCKNDDLFAPVASGSSAPTAIVVLPCSMGSMARINQGISSDKAREIVKFIKDSKVKAQVAVQGEQVRVSSKSKDTLQEVMGALREHDFGIPLQYTNYR